MPAKHYFALTMIFSMVAPFDLAHAEDLSLSHTAQPHLLWINQIQNNYQYFSSAGDSVDISPLNHSIGYQYQASSQLSWALSYAKTSESLQWLNPRITTEQVFNQTQISSTTKRISGIWLADDFGVNFGYSQVEYDESSITFLPRLLSRIEEKNQLLDLGYADYIEIDDWSFGWGLGIQYAQLDADNLDVLVTNTTTFINTQLEQTGWNALLDINLSYWLAFENFSLSPQLTLDWNLEISNDGDQQIAFFRDGALRRLDSANDHNVNLAIPDSGFWTLGVAIDWHNDWYTSLTYGQSISAAQSLDSISLDLSVSF